MHVWCGPSHWAGEKPLHKIPKTRAEAESKLNKLYNGRVLLFSKESLREVYHQLKKPPTRGNKIAVRTLDGATVEWDILTGDTRPAPKAGLEYVMEAPRIDYLSLEHLKQQLDWTGLHLAYCNLHITHLMTLRDKVTKKPIPEPVHSIKQTREFFRRSIQPWKESEAYRHLRSTLETVKSTHQINNIVSFACGDISMHAFPRSAVQHALLVTLQELLSPQNSGSIPTIPCLAQDPIYTDVDKAVLAENGIQVVNDPEGFLATDDFSIVFSCSPNIPVKQIVADLARPAVLIWDQVEEEEGDVVMTDPDSSRVIDMIRDYYDEFPFRHDEYFRKNFSSVTIYIRRQSMRS